MCTKYLSKENTIIYIKKRNDLLIKDVDIYKTNAHQMLFIILYYKTESHMKHHCTLILATNIF